MSLRKYADTDIVDIVVVGSGAAGGVIARETARAGLSVVGRLPGPPRAPPRVEHPPF
jgi:glycine/D-amino acid oxidase-like deaminating enzyme